MPSLGVVHDHDTSLRRSMMSQRAIEDIAQQSGGDMFAAPFFEGSVWRSARAASTNVSYEADIPVGLHLAFGLADMRTHAKGLGGFEARGPTLTVMNLMSEPARFRTEIRASPSRAFGVHLPTPRLDDELLGRIRKLNGAQSFQVVQDTSAVGRAMKLLETIDPWYQGPARAMVVQARGLELLAIVERWLSGSKAHDFNTRYRRKAEEVRALIESRLAEPLTLDGIAKEVGVNVRSLSDLFREQQGISIASFLTRRRMEVGARMLAEGATVAEAAYAVGYQPNAFSTAFRRHFGYPPSAFLKGGIQGSRPIPNCEDQTPADEG